MYTPTRTCLSLRFVCQLSIITESRRCDSFSPVNFSKINHIWDHENCYSTPILSCSIGIFDSSRVVPFRSTIPGETQPQVGRWHSFRKKDDIDDDKGYELNSRAGTNDGTVSWEDIWNGSASKDIPLPDELRSLDQSTIDSIIFFSDLQPEGLCQSLGALPSTTTQLGLIAASTHFISARPVTLCRNDSFFGDGAVGVALLKRTNESKMVSSRVDFLGTQKLSGPLTVTRCEGNMINGLDFSNPTQLLLNVIRLAGVDMLAPP
ncbi:hypothetical protein BYT27DRAFT_7342793 [Phlegmacium glaucopus]|nr:hypothetical protein BYT27DRAFT_7342793 [Phlegmacium glaucopus]